MASLGTSTKDTIATQHLSAESIDASSASQKQENARKSQLETIATTATLHWFAQIGHDLTTNDDKDNNGGAVDREERLRLIKDRQNEERQRKLEELKAQALAAQKYREQKEEERKRRIDEMRLKENDKRQQVEDRKKAIMDAERERREYIVRKNQERDARLDTKRRNERSSISFAFGSSTPRLLDPVEVSLITPSGSYWGHRRSTSITNVSYGSNAGAPQLSRRSSERELSDGPKKRATSAGGLDRPDDLHKMSTSMYEVFNWGHINESRPKRLSLFVGASDINIDDPPPPSSTTQASAKTTNSKPNDDSNVVDSSSPFILRSVARRKTDLMPTIPSPRDSNFGSRTSLYCHTPRTQDFKNKGRAVSMTRLDQLAQPTRRNGEHIRAVIERQRRHQIESNDAFEKSASSTTRKMSRSLTHLSGSSASNRNKHLVSSSFTTGKQVRPLRKSNATKSMTQLVTAKLLSTPKLSTTNHHHLPTVVQSRNNPAKLRTQQTAHEHEIDSRTTNVSTAGSRSGDATPGGSSSRPGSAMSTSTTASGVVFRRTGTTTRKPRPASIAGTGMTQEITDSLNKQKKDKPPLRPNSAAIRKSSSTTSANVPSSPNVSTTKMSSSITHETPKRGEKRLPTKKTSTPRATTPKLSSPQTETLKINPVSVEPEQQLQQLQQLSQTVVLAAPEVQDSGLNEMQIEQKPLIDTLEAVDDLSNSTSVETIIIDEIATASPHNSDPSSVIECNADVKTDDRIEIKTEIVVSSEPEKVATNEAVDVTNAENNNNNNYNNNKTLELENNEMTASMIQRRINTEEEAKAALAERRRLAREEAERQAEMERQRLEAEHQLALKLQAEEDERQRKLEEETLRLVAEQQLAEEQRLQQAIEEAKQRELEIQQRKEEEERQKLEREEQERKAREEAEKLKLEVAERLKKEEKEREERRKRVEAIMSRTRAKNASGGTPANNTQNKTDEKDATAINDDSDGNAVMSVQNETTTTNNVTSSVVVVQNDSNRRNLLGDYEKNVTDKENALILTFSNLIDNNLVPTTQPQQPQQQQQQNNIHLTQEISLHNSNVKANGGGKLIDFNTLTDDHQNDIVKSPISNGNGHALINNLDNKISESGVNITNSFSDAITNQLLDLTIDPNQMTEHTTVNYNNNSLITSAPLVTSDSHETKEISLL